MCIACLNMMLPHPQGSPIHLTFGRLYNQGCQANALYYTLTCKLSTERVQSYISRRLQQTMLICHLLSVWHCTTYSTRSLSHTILLYSQLYSALAKKPSQGNMCCNHAAAAEKEKEKKNKLHLRAVVVKRPRR